MNLNPLTLFSALRKRWDRARAMESLTNDLHEAWQERAERPLTPHERQLLGNALTFSTITAADVCIPRADIRAVPAKATYAQVVKAFAASKHSRLPVHGKNLDEIVGVITLKSLIGHVNNPAGFSLIAAMHSPVFVPEGMPVSRVLQQMRRHRAGIVMVTDEYGGIAGLMTLNDVLGELVGQVGDETSGDQGSAIQSVGGGRFRVPAGMALEQVSATLSITLPASTEEVSTIGGMVMHHARRVPGVGEVVNLPGGLAARVLTGDARRVELLELQLPQNRATKQ
jgi:magnesium and cobalt transporter